MKRLFLSIVMLLLVICTKAQTQFWNDNFEGAAPSSGSRTATGSAFFPSSAPYTKYFGRVLPGQLNLQNGTYSGYGGSYIWAGEDIDAALTGTNFSQSNRQSITWSGINIAGKTGLSFTGKFACDNAGGAVWEGPSAPPCDFMIVEYRIDGGAWASAVRLFSNNAINGSLALETTGDSLAEGAVLASYVFTSLSYNIPTTGTTLDLRFIASSNGGATEELAIDDFELLESAACPLPALALTSQTNIACNGGTNGAASFSASNGGPFTYTWSPSGGNSFSASGLSAGVYTCVTTNSCGATATATVNITQPTALTVNPVSQTNVACNGGSSGAASVSASGGTTAYSYNWTPGNPTGDGTGSVTGLAAGTWSCTVTDANACTRTQTFNITQPTAIALTPAAQTNISCNGGSNGAASVNAATGGAGGFTYNWTPGNPTGDGTTSVTGLTAGTWSCTVTDANACTRIQTFNITQPTAISLTPAAQTNISCNGGSNGAASVNPATGGAGGFTYNWTPGNPTGDGTTSVTGLTAGSWTCTVTDANACTSSTAFNITQPTAIALNPASQTNISCNGGSNGAASVNAATGGAGGFTYNWTPGNPTGDGTTSVTGLTAGSWTCTVTDANACTSSTAFNITQPTAIALTPASQTNISCNGGSNGAASVNAATGGAGGFTYNWTPGNPTGDGTTSVTGLTAGAWTCTVTDANACTSSTAFNITQPTAISLNPASQTNISCNGGSNGAASVNAATGGAGGFTYNWTPGNPTGDGTTSVTGLTAGSWTCTVTDANSCSSSTVFNITQPASALATSTAVTHVTCFGSTNGSATVTVTGGTSAYTYLWSTGATTSVIISQSSGTKSYTVTDANGCTSIGNAIISQPASALTVSTTVTDVLCNGGSTGSATATATGGTSSYTYLWSTGATTSVITSQTSGVKTVTVTDFNGCTSTGSVSINEPTLLTAVTSQTNTTCNGVCDGAADVTATGGILPYSYNWSNGNMTTPQNGLCVGSYIVTVTDANGCILTQTITITEPTVVSVSAASGNILCNGGSTTVTVSGSGGSGTLAGTGIFTQTAGTYTYTVTDANACSAGTVITITEPAQLTVNLSAAPIACNGSTAQVNIVANGGTSPYSGTTPAIVPAGSYSYTVTDDNGCAATETISVTEPAAIVASQTITLCNGQSLTIGTNTYNASGTYVDVLQSQLNGCDSTLTTNLSVNPVIDATTSLSGLTISANESSATYQWIDCDNSNQPIAGETNQSFTASANGNYAVIITQNSCSETSACVNISTVGIKERNNINSISIYPNPSSGSYEISGLVLNSKIAVYDAIGQIVYLSLANGSKEIINISEMPDGVYIIQVSSENELKTKKIIKKGYN